MAEFRALSAAADQLGTGSIEVPMFETEIFDIVRRESVALQRIPAVRATGHPHRYFDQTAVAAGAFTDPRNISPTPTGPTRVERPAFIKAITAQSNIGLFDKEVTQQQGQFASVIAKDIADISTGIVRTQASAIWSGTDTSLATPTTTQYVGLLTQITMQATIAKGASIIDGLKAQVAKIMSNKDFNARPTAFYVNPLLANLIDAEAKAASYKFNQVEVVAGVVVNAISTQAGVLPIISDAFVPVDTAAAYGFAAPGAGNSNYYAVIVTESELERPYISGESDSSQPRVFQLGLQSALAGQYVAVMFDAIIAKGADRAHSVVAVVAAS